MKKSVKIFHSFEEEEKANIEYWKNLEGSKKIEILEAIRAEYMRANNIEPKFQHVYRIVKRKS